MDKSLGRNKFAFVALCDTLETNNQAWIKLDLPSPSPNPTYNVGHMFILLNFTIVLSGGEKGSSVLQCFFRCKTQCNSLLLLLCQGRFVFHCSKLLSSVVREPDQCCGMSWVGWEFECLLFRQLKQPRRRRHFITIRELIITITNCQIWLAINCPDFSLNWTV